MTALKQAPAVVAFGGGHGLYGALSALRYVTPRLTAVVTVADDGGSSGRLRAEFGIDDCGEVPSAADRIAYVNALSIGYDSKDLIRALDGRAAKCRRSRLWKSADTAENFLRIAWLFKDKRRIDDALIAAPATVDDTTIVRGPGGTFVAGRELAEPSAPPAPAPDPPPSPEGEGFTAINDWIEKQQ